MGSRIQQAFASKAPAAPTGTYAPPGGGYAAIVADDAATMGQKVHVVIPSADPRVQHGAPARWMPRNDAQVMPRRGDRALVMIDENQEPWILVWWPNGYS